MEENVSKALIMAGGILLGVMILVIAVFLFNNSVNFSKTFDDNIDNKKRVEFNNNFEIYLGRDNLTAQDIVSVANLAKAYNEKNELPDTDLYYIRVFLTGSGVLSAYNRMDKLGNNGTYTISTFLATYGVDNINDVNLQGSTFKCLGIEYNPNNNRVNQINFTKN